MLHRICSGDTKRTPTSAVATAVESTPWKMEMVHELKVPRSFGLRHGDRRCKACSTRVDHVRGVAIASACAGPSGGILLCCLTLKCSRSKVWFLTPWRPSGAARSRRRRRHRTPPQSRPPAAAALPTRCLQWAVAFGVEIRAAEDAGLLLRRGTAAAWLHGAVPPVRGSPAP